jgi:hypothetical protein
MAWLISPLLIRTEVRVDVVNVVSAPMLDVLTRQDDFVPH